MSAETHKLPKWIDDIVDYLACEIEANHAGYSLPLVLRSDLEKMCLAVAEAQRELDCKTMCWFCAHGDVDGSCWEPIPVVAQDGRYFHRYVNAALDLIDGRIKSAMLCTASPIRRAAKG